MIVTVKHFSTLKKAVDQDPIEVELEPGATIIELLTQLGIEQNDVGILVVNGKQATFAQKLQDNGHITIIPHIGGG